MNDEELHLNLEDREWPLTTIDHDRMIARAIVVDGDDNFYFVRANRDDGLQNNRWRREYENGRYPKTP